MKLFNLFLHFCCFLSLWLSHFVLAQDAGGAPNKLIIVGDSLTEGYGVAQAQAYPSRLQVLIDKKFGGKTPKWVVVNSGISGSTAASAPTRVAWALKQHPKMLILALGANDGLRGTPIQDIEENLSRALAAAKTAGTLTYLAGMQIPPNYGAAYTKGFKALFPKLAAKHGAKLIPFLLDKVGGEARLNQTDGIHPNAEGHQILAETVFENIKADL